MFYSNEYHDKSMYSKTINFGKFIGGVNSDLDSNVMSSSSTPMSYNFRYEDGALRDGFGLKALQFRYSNVHPDAYKLLDSLTDNSHGVGCWLFTMWADDAKSHRPFIIIYTSLGEFYYNRIHTESTELVKIEGLTFSEKPIIASCKIDGVDTLILVSETDGMYTWQYPYNVQKIDNAPSISSMCVHNDRLFVTTNGEKRTIMYSDILDPTNFTLSEGGVIELADEFGRSNKVISFGGYVYIFRDFNIARLTTYSNKNDFEVTQLYVSNSKIYDKTVCVCGDKILYLASDGLYEFNGSTSKKVELNINNLFKGMDNANAVAGYSNGYYYLSCTINYGDDDIVGEEYEGLTQDNNCLIKLNVESGYFNIMRGYDIRDISVINDVYKSEVCIVAKNIYGGYKMGILDESGTYLRDSMTKLWKSAFNDFGCPNKDKIVREITLETTQNITVQVVTENGVRNFDITGKKGYQTIRPYVKGKKIGINFKSNVSDNYISNPKITVGYL